MSDADDDAVFEAAMSIAAEGRWRGARLADIAERAGRDPAALSHVYRDKTAILEALAARIDTLVAEQVDEAFADPDIPVRERLQELLLLRFEAMTPYKAGIAALLQDLPGDPMLAARGLPALGRAMTATLKDAGLHGGGPCGLLRVKGLSLVYLATLRVWLHDDSPDLAATMRALDERLLRLESLAQGLGFARQP